LKGCEDPGCVNSECDSIPVKGHIKGIDFSFIREMQREFHILGEIKIHPPNILFSVKDKTGAGKDQTPRQ